MLRLRKTAQGVVCCFEYATDLFDRSTIERLAGHFRTLLEGIAAAPNTDIGELPLLSEGERNSLVKEWSGRAANYLSDQYITELVAECGFEENGEPSSTLRAYVLEPMAGPSANRRLWGCLHRWSWICRSDIEKLDFPDARFIPDPFSRGDRLYQTGDVARWRPDGVLEILSRAAHHPQAVIENYRAEEAYQAPRSSTEKAIAEILSEILGVERIGIHDDFFALGGHSLLGTQVIARLRSVFEVELPLRTLYEAQTVEELATQVEVARRKRFDLVQPKLEARAGAEYLPLSFAQERLWLLEQIEAAGAAYNISATFRLNGQLDVGALERAFAAVVDRHEILRTRFVVKDGAPMQAISASGQFRLEEEDVSDRPAEEREAAARRRAGAIAGMPFDLTRGPLFRAALLRLSGEEHIAVLVMHHIVSDGWSWRVLIQELGTLYAAFVEGRPSPLCELPMQYADYAVWQREWLRGEVLQRQVGYWKERLSGAPAALDLPTDRARPAVQSFRGASVSIELPQELIGGLQDVARSEGATLFMVLLAAFQILLSRWTGQTDVVVGAPLAGRTHREVEGLIGFFVNMLPLRTDLSGDPSFRSLLKQVRETALGAYEHQDLPFEKLVEELQPVRDLSRRPIFQVMLALQNVLPREWLDLPGLTLQQFNSQQLLTAKFRPIALLV